MNLNKITIILSCSLILITFLFVIFYSSNNRNETLSNENELFLINVCYIPNVIRSYKEVSHIYGRQNCLLFRYVQTSCNSCNDKYLNALLTFQDEIGKDNVWIYSAYPNDRSSKIRLGTELAKFNYRNIPRDSLFIPVHRGKEISYFAWINDSGEIDMVFIPDRDNIRLTQNFFLEVKEKMKKNLFVDD